MMRQNYITTIGEQYKLIKELNQSRWSQTFLAEDLRIPERLKCIIKKLRNLPKYPEDLLEIKNAWERQTSLWQTWQTKIVNSRITPILACFQENNDFCLIQKYIEGETLAAKLQTGDQFTEAEVIDRLKEFLSILIPLHQEGIIHGNLKPSNFVIDPASQQLNLIDLGIFHHLEEILASKNDSIKSPNQENNYYPSNRVVSKNKLTAQSDYYAVGMMVVQMLAGTYPAQLPVNPSVKDICQQVNRQVNFQLLQIIERMSDLNSDNSYTSGIEIIADLDKIDFQVKNNQPEKSNPIAETFILSSGLKSKIDLAKQKPQYLLAVVLGFLALGGIGEILSPTIRPGYHVWQGQQQLSQAPKKALKSFQQAIKIQPQSASAWKNRGDALFRLERYRAALVAYNKALEISPKNAKIWQGRGEALYRLERFEAAVTAYEKALQLEPKDVTLLNRKGRALYKLERYADALAAQEQALKLEPNSVDAMKDRGVALLGMGEHEKAMVAFSNAQTFDPLNPELWQNKALAMQYINQPQQAMRLYQEAVEAYDRQIIDDPTNTTAMLDKANVLGKLQQHQRALLSYDQALTINPDSHLAWLGKGNTLFALRRYDEALSAFDRASKLQPKSYLTWHNRGSLLRDGLKKYPEAIASYDRSLEINPNFYHGWRDRGIALSQSQQHQEAIQSFKKALDIKPNDYKSWVARGIALSSLNRNEEAIYSFDKAAEINPRDPFVLMNRGAALEKSQRYNEACAAYFELVKINPGFSPAIQARKKLGCN